MDALAKTTKPEKLKEDLKIANENMEKLVSRWSSLRMKSSMPR